MNLSQGLNVQLNAFTLPESSSYLAHLRSKWAVCAPQQKNEFDIPGLRQYNSGKKKKMLSLAFWMGQLHVPGHLPRMPIG